VVQARRWFKINCAPPMRLTGRSSFESASIGLQADWPTIAGMVRCRVSGRALAVGARRAAWAVVRYLVEALAASGAALSFVPADFWPDGQRAYPDAPAPVIELTRAERRQWASLVRRLR
jgi:hypothetical protein